MSAEQVVRDFLSAFEAGGVEPAIPYLATTMRLTMTNPPMNGGRDEFVGQGRVIKQAMPDFKWGVQTLTVSGNQVDVTLHPTGTQTGVLALSAFMPGAPDLPPTGKKVGAPDHFVFTVNGDKIAGILIDSPAGGGLLGMLGQLGIQLPG